VTYLEEDSGEKSSLEVERGDVYNLEQGSILYIQSYPNATRQRLRIFAIFTSDGINAEDPTVRYLLFRFPLHDYKLAGRRYICSYL